MKWWLWLLWLPCAAQVELCQVPLVVTLKATGTNYAYWTVNGLYMGYASSIEVMATDTGMVTATASINDPCPANAEYKLAIVPCKDCAIYWPNAATEQNPWTPKSMCPFRFEIFNRWGELIYTGPPEWTAENAQNDVYVAVIYAGNRRYISRVTVVR
jgi:hypothetical protein